MSTIFEQQTVCTLGQAAKLLADKIEVAFATFASSVRSSVEPAIVRLQVNIEPTPPLVWLASQMNPVKTYWSDRESGFEIAGVGVADIVTGEGDIDYDTVLVYLNKFLAPGNEDLRYYGGFRFSKKNENFRDNLWDKFGSYRFVLPRFEVLRQSDETHLVCNIVFGKESCKPSQILAELRDVVSLIESRHTEVPRIVARSDTPDKEEWNALVRATLESFDRGELDKLVLGRRTSIEFSAPLNALLLLEKLKEASPDCYHYCLQLGDNVGNNVAFIGASPEQLYQRSGQNIKTEAVAGTRPRGASEETDNTLGRELLSTEKERHEHQYVVYGVSEALEQVCRSVHTDNNVSLLKLARLQHLITRFEGVLKDDISDADILRTLHPTPAVGWYPVRHAVEKINGALPPFEPFDRGWYAGPVGWLGHDAAEFAVGIRSGLVERNKLHLFAGAGIVNGSTAQGEWSEIENKVSNFIKALTEQ